MVVTAKQNIYNENLISAQQEEEKEITKYAKCAVTLNKYVYIL